MIPMNVYKCLEKNNTSNDFSHQIKARKKRKIDNIGSYSGICNTGNDQSQPS